MLKLPMHPRYSRMLVEAARFGCVPAAALCAALVSGRDLLMRLGRDDKHIPEARELFEASQESDFYTLMRAYQFAKQEQLQRGDLPPLWHPRPDRPAGRADLRADSCRSRSSRACCEARTESRPAPESGADHAITAPSTHAPRRPAAPLPHDRLH